MITIHTPEEIRALHDKVELCKDLMKLQAKYKLRILPKAIDQLEHEVRVEMEKYDEFIGKQARAITGEIVTIDEVVVTGEIISCVVHTTLKTSVLSITHLELI